MVGFGLAAVTAAVAAATLAIAVLAYEAYKLRGWEAARPKPQGLGAPLRSLSLDGGKQLTEYENGCAKTYPSGVIEWARWPAVDDIEVKSAAVPTPSGRVEQHHAICLELYDGTRIFLCGRSELLATFGTEACETVYLLQLVRHRERVESGGSVPVCGTRGLELDGDGLHRGRRRLPWSLVDDIEVDRGGYVRFRRAGAQVGWAGFRTGGPRQRAFLQLARELYARHHASADGAVG